MKKKILPVLFCLTLLVGCGENSSSLNSSLANSSSSSQESTSSSSFSSSSSQISTSTSNIDLINEFAKLAQKDNYTLEIEDYGGDFSEYFLKDAFYYEFLDNKTESGNLVLNGYLKDDKGVYSVNINSQDKISFGYYEYDDDNDRYLTDIYQGMYSLKDLYLDESYFTFDAEQNCYVIDTLDCDEARILFSICGYDPDSTTSGMSISDVKTIKLTKNEDGYLQFQIVFNNSRGTSKISIVDVDNTKLDSRISKAIENGSQAKIRVDQNDVAYDYLAELKNLSNFTLKIQSDYNYGNWTNYTNTTKYTSSAYYSISSREGETDLGYVLKDGKVYNLYFDEISESYLIGDVVKSSSGSTYSSLDDILYSFSSTSWDPNTFKMRKEGDKYIIEETDYLVNVFYMLDETAMKFMLQNLEFKKNGNDFEFVFNMVYDLKIKFTVTDINTTKIGDYN